MTAPRPGPDGTPPLTVVTLFAGRTALLSRWVRLLLDASRTGLPPESVVVAADNAADPTFSGNLRAAVDHLDRHGVRAVRVDLRHVGTYHAGSDPEYMSPGRHLQVLKLYNAILPTLGGDIVITLEDDVFPPPAGLVALHRRLREAGATVSAVAAPYASPVNPAIVNATWDDGGGGWGTWIAWDDLPAEPVEVGMVGGGCTAWRNRDLQAVLPLPDRWWELMLGWDGELCSALRARGTTILLDPDARADHHVHGGR